jgi:hypothetical protein
LRAYEYQIILQDFEDTERLNGIAFLDAQVYLTSVACIKNMFLIGDLCKSIWFVAFQASSVCYCSSLGLTACGVGRTTKGGIAWQRYFTIGGNL